MKPNRIIAAVGLMLWAGCNIPDADLKATAALTDIDMSASTDQLPSRQTRITGTITVGYTSTKMLQVRILDNDTPVYVGSYAVDATSIHVDETVELLDPGVNELTIEATYNAQSIKQKLIVTVPAALQSFSLMPASTAVNVFSVGLSGQIELGHVSDELPSLEILVNGMSVYDESLDASSLSVTFSTSVPLLREGPNEIVGIVTYAGQELSRKVVVDVAVDAPEVLFPTWATNYVPHVGLSLSGDLTVTADAAYTIEDVEFSVDGGPWLPAVYNGGDSYGVTIVDPDIGESVLAVRVVTENDGHLNTTSFFDVFSVDPIFDCATPTQSMLPDNIFLQNLGRENRTMVGYFGDPLGGHVVSFVLSADVPNDGPYDVVAMVTSYGRTAMSVQFDVGDLKCQNDPCIGDGLDYDLSVYVDGALLCQQASFGRIDRY